MAYSMFECPKLQQTKSLKFYPEEYVHHVPFRHKNLPSGFELTMENCYNSHLGKSGENYSTAVHSSTTRQKCPIYVHNFPAVRHNDGDCRPKTHKKSKKKQTINKLEETYWANWKPEKKNSGPKIPVLTNCKPEIQVIKSAPVKMKKIRLYPQIEDVTCVKDESIEKVASVSQEIQTEDVVDQDVQNEVSPSVEEILKITEPLPSEPVLESPEEVVADTKFLHHTDSFILNVKKQQDEKDHFEQPKCIRLYRKTGKPTSKGYVKGGSYPLKSCLKKDSNFSKASSKLARPGSPMIVSSSFSGKGKYSKTHRH